jgi:hypothetical protein
MRGLLSAHAPASCNDAANSRTHGSRRAGIMRGSVPGPVPRPKPRYTRLSLLAQSLEHCFYLTRSGTCTPDGGASVQGNAGETDQSKAPPKSTVPPENRAPVKSNVLPEKWAPPKSTVPPENCALLKLIVPPEKWAAVKLTVPLPNLTVPPETRTPKNWAPRKLTVPPETWAPKWTTVPPENSVASLPGAGPVGSVEHGHALDRAYRQVEIGHGMRVLAALGGTDLSDLDRAGVRVRGAVGGHRRLLAFSGLVPLPLRGEDLAVRPRSESFEVTSLSWSPVTESNRRPSPYHGDALPTELTGQLPVPA